MNDPDMLELRERDSDNDGIADEPNRLQQKDAEYDALITQLKTERIAKQEELEAIVGEDAGWAGATTDYLAVRHLPRCIYLEMRGSHYAISLPTPGNTLWAYAPEVSLDNGSVMGTHCVYNSIKPRCVTVSKGSQFFVKEMRATCLEEVFTGTCLNQCERFFCSSSYDKDGNGQGADTKDRDACGKDDGASPGAFDRCANCCGRLSANEGWSSCLTRRRRRRLREAVTAGHRRAQESGASAAMENYGDESYKYSKHECAEACLSTNGCMGWDVRNGACIITKACDATAGEGEGWRTGKWMIKHGVTREDMGMEPQGTPKKKRVRKNKPAPPMGPDLNEIMDVAVIAQDLVDDPMTEGHDMADKEDAGEAGAALAAGMGQDEDNFGAKETYDGNDAFEG